MIKSGRFLSLTVSIFSFIWLNLAYGAQHKKHATGPTVVDAFKAIHQEMVISVNQDSITIGDKKEQKTYVIVNGLGGTDVYVDNVKGTISDVRPGMAVTISGDISHATTILAHAAAPHKEPKKK